MSRILVRVLARFSVGLYIARQLILRAFGVRYGKRAFLENYGPEYLLPLSHAHRAVRSGASHCIACGLCDSQFELMHERYNAALPGPSALALAYSRDPRDALHARAYIAYVRQVDLGVVERVCPTGVPLAAIADMLDEQCRDLSSPQ